MPDRAVNVLFLCTGNSARSILAEAILNRAGKGRLRAFSAGSAPKDAPHPEALALLESLGHDTSGCRAKSWDEFARPDAPVMDIVITVCGNAAAETCPVWPGAPVSAHWGVPDPAAVTGPPDKIARAFRTAHDRLQARICALLALPLDRLDPESLTGRLAAIGRTNDTGAAP